MGDKKPNIVVIDESAPSLALYARSTEPLAVDLQAFASPDDALAHLGDHDADLVFLDVLMRDVDGLTLLKRLRGMPRHASTPVVMVTSKDYAQDRSVAREHGVADYLLKPLRSQEIRDVIRRYTGAAAPEGEDATRR